MGPVEVEGAEPVLRATGGSEQPLSISDTEDRTWICFISRLESCDSQDLDDYAVPADLFTHTVEHTHTHLLQVSGTSSRWLHKAKKGEKSSAKRQTQVQ